MNDEQLTVLMLRIDKLEQKLEDLALNARDTFTFEQAYQYLKISASMLYKLVCRKAIVAYKPGGKLLYFKKQDLQNWMLSGRKKTAKEEKAQALNTLSAKRI